MIWKTVSVVILIIILGPGAALSQKILVWDNDNGATLYSPETLTYESCHLGLVRVSGGRDAGIARIRGHPLKEKAIPNLKWD